MMTGDQLRAARYAIGRAIGATKLSWSEMAELVGLLDPTGNGKDTIRKWENGAGPSGPVSTLVDLILEGVRHIDPRHHRRHAGAHPGQMRGLDPGDDPPAGIHQTAGAVARFELADLFPDQGHVGTPTSK